MGAWEMRNETWAGHPISVLNLWAEGNAALGRVGIQTILDLLQRLEVDPVLAAVPGIDRDWVPTIRARVSDLLAEQHQTSRRASPESTPTPRGGVGADRPAATRKGKRVLSEDRDTMAYRPGSPVLIGGDIKAHLLVTQIHDDGSVSYVVSWWDGRKHNTEPFSANQVAPTSKTNLIFIAAPLKD